MANPFFTPPIMYGTPPIAQRPGEEDGSVIGATLANATKKKQSTLGQVGSFILEALTGLPSAEHRQQRDDRELAQYGRKSALLQQLEQAKWQGQQEWERKNPKPAGPTNTQSTYEFIKSINPEWGNSYIQNMATAPPLVVPNSDGTRTVYPQGSIPRTAAPAQPQIIQQLPPGVKPYTPGGAGQQTPRTFR